MHSKIYMLRYTETLYFLGASDIRSCTICGASPCPGLIPDDQIRSDMMCSASDNPSLKLATPKINC